jgi:hypothetical protein
VAPVVMANHMMVAVMFPCARPSAFNHDIDNCSTFPEILQEFSHGIFTLASISFICGIDVILLGKVFYENPKIAL